MSRYSSYSSLGTYRSPYLESSTSSYTSAPGFSTFSSPTYESKFDNVISRNADGLARSRAGTSTKYDYLSTYGSTVASKYDRSPTYQSNSYASVINTDDLTRNYFEKYYSKPASSSISSVLDTVNNSSSTGRTSRALSVYLDNEDTNKNISRRDSLLQEPRTFRSTSVISEAVTSPSTEALRNRFSRRLSVYDDIKDSSKETNINNNAITNGNHKDEEPSYTYSSGYTRYSSRIKSSPPPPTRKVRDISPVSSRGDEKEREKSPTSSIQRTYGGTSGYSRIAERSQPDTLGSRSKYGSLEGKYGSTYTNGYGEDEDDNGSTSESTGCCGLRNIGNTCFMNSVIQCLSNTKQLTSYLLKDEHLREINTSNSSMKGSLIKAFASVIKNLWKGGGRVVDPSSLKGAVNRFAPRFSGYNQEDSQEFLRYLLEGLHEDVNRVLTKPQPINSEIDSSLSVCEQAMEAWKRYLRRDDSQLVDLFVGQLKSTLRCSDCGYESVTFEPFWDLSLGIPSRSGEVSLLDCFESFTKEEILDGDEMPTCERCKTRKKCSKRYSLYRLPKILVIHLKRFSPSDRFRQKLSTTVTFPLTGLSLSRYSDSSSTNTYNCYAVSNHSGTLYSGHYTAYAKHSQSGQWYSYNDSRVSKCSSSSVMSNENYLLFFELS